MTTVLPVPDTAGPDTAAVAERLMAEFEGRLGLAEVTRAVRECRQDLAAEGTQPGTGALERCAREHLARRCGR